MRPIDNVIKLGTTLYGLTVLGGTNNTSPDDPTMTGNGTIFALALSALTRSP
jgi:hypothetical protein